MIYQTLDPFFPPTLARRGGRRVLGVHYHSGTYINNNNNNDNNNNNNVKYSNSSLDNDNGDGDDDDNDHSNYIARQRAAGLWECRYITPLYIYIYIYHYHYHYH